jgi:hypothetical protein
LGIVPDVVVAAEAIGRNGLATEADNQYRAAIARLSEQVVVANAR